MRVNKVERIALMGGLIGALLPIQEARSIRHYQEQMLMAGIVVKSCHTALQTFSCLFYQFSVCAAPLVCGPLARATCCFLKRRVNNLFKYFTVCYSRLGLIFWGVSFCFSDLL